MAAYLGGSSGTTDISRSKSTASPATRARGCRLAQTRNEDPGRGTSQADCGGRLLSCGRTRLRPWPRARGLAARGSANRKSFLKAASRLVAPTVLWSSACASRKEPKVANDLKQAGKPDDSRINVDQEHELGYWSVQGHLSRERLLAFTRKPLLRQARCAPAWCGTRVRASTSA